MQDFKSFYTILYSSLENHTTIPIQQHGTWAYNAEKKQKNDIYKKNILTFIIIPAPIKIGKTFFID